eukprot:127871_1
MVVTGAGIEGGRLNFQEDFENIKDEDNVIDVAPLPYGFAKCETTADGLCPMDSDFFYDKECTVMHSVSKRDTPFGTHLIPAEICQANPGATSMTLDLYEGEDVDVRNNYFLGEIVIHDIATRDRNKPCGNILFSVEIAQNGSLIYTATTNPIWDVIKNKFVKEHNWSVEMIGNSDLYYRKPKLYTEITGELRDKRNKNREEIYELILITEVERISMEKSVKITQQDIDNYKVGEYAYTVYAIDSEQDTCNATAQQIEIMKSMFCQQSFPLLLKAFDDTIYMEQEKIERLKDEPR